MAASLHWLDEYCAEATRRASEQPIDEWLYDNVSLDTTSPIQGPYDVANSLQLRDPPRISRRERQDGDDCWADSGRAHQSDARREFVGHSESARLTGNRPKRYRPRYFCSVSIVPELLFHREVFVLKTAQIAFNNRYVVTFHKPSFNLGIAQDI
jgi:hypothetical protein